MSWSFGNLFCLLWLHETWKSYFLKCSFHYFLWCGKVSNNRVRTKERKSNQNILQVNPLLWMRCLQLAWPETNTKTKQSTYKSPKREIDLHSWVIMQSRSVKSDEWGSIEGIVVKIWTSSRLETNKQKGLGNSFIFSKYLIKYYKMTVIVSISVTNEK